MDKLLESILTTKRCHNTKGELDFLGWLHGYIKTLGHKFEPMAEGCTVVKVGSKKAKTLFSCHIDTVHGALESDGSKQTAVYDPNFEHIFVGDKAQTCLGADDGAGIYIMLKMLEAKVEGTYIFHRGEEKGGIGARAMLVKHEKWLAEFDHSIAFDRPGTDEVIITQSGSVCASPEFGAQLAAMLNADGLKYTNSTKGVFTDNKIYRQVIPCNVNLGVGYFFQHTNQEYLDWGHLQKLLAMCIKLDWSKLKVTRKIEPEAYTYRGAAFRGRDFMNDSYDYDYDLDMFQRGKQSLGSGKQLPTKVAPIKGKLVPTSPVEPELQTLEELQQMSYEDILDWCSAGDPEDLATTFSEMLLEIDSLRAKVDRYQTLIGL